jgi:hypothetical protein
LTGKAEGGSDEGSAKSQSALSGDQKVFGRGAADQDQRFQKGSFQAKESAQRNQVNPTRSQGPGPTLPRGS